MKDLRYAILAVLSSSIPIKGTGVRGWDNTHSVVTDTLKVLQAEYNIHFIEPEDTQLKVIE